jgi:hypothetical protein
MLQASEIVMQAGGLWIVAPQSPFTDRQRAPVQRLRVVEPADQLVEDAEVITQIGDHHQLVVIVAEQVAEGQPLPEHLLGLRVAPLVSPERAQAIKCQDPKPTVIWIRAGLPGGLGQAGLAGRLVAPVLMGVRLKNQGSYLIGSSQRAHLPQIRRMAQMPRCVHATRSQ